MSKIRVVVNVATGHYVKGQERLTEALAGLGEDYLVCRDELPPGAPAHAENPYAFKPYALDWAIERYPAIDTVMWADASIIPIRDITPVWEYAERHGLWFANNGWRNDQWTCDAAYPILFPSLSLERARFWNRRIRHVVATVFAVSVQHEIGRVFLAEYRRLADAGAFKGPWWNSAADYPDYAKRAAGNAPCGPPSCYGHRHDQTAASVIVGQLGHGPWLTDPPMYFDYYRRCGEQDPRTILVAKGL